MIALLAVQSFAWILIHNAILFINTSTMRGITIIIRGFHKSTTLAIVALLPFVCSHTFAVSFFILMISY